ncbi:MAG: hypothetical protein AVDCRST_MAG51-1795, partial [uncultured Ramlibacter sp.]
SEPTKGMRREHPTHVMVTAHW